MSAAFHDMYLTTVLMVRLANDWLESCEFPFGFIPEFSSCESVSGSSEPVVAHAFSVPLLTTEPAPFKLTLRTRTHHVHTATIFFHRNLAFGAGVSGFVYSLL